MKRIIIAIPVGPFEPPPGSVISDGHVDYVTRDEDEEVPANALYVGEMDEMGQVWLVKAAPEGFEHSHTFAGWPPVYRV